MASTIPVPTKASIGAYSTDVANDQASDGNYDPRLANAVYDGLTAAAADVTALQSGSTITGINGASVPAGGALTTGNVLQVTGAAALGYAAVNLAGGANYVSGVLPWANVASNVGNVHSVRGVVTTNVANLGAFTVAGHDGLTFIEGERVLLAKQTTAAQDGIYVVGVVAVGVAPLTRAADWPAAAVMPASSRIVVNEGTTFAHSEWMATVAGAVTVATTAPAFYPRVVKGTTVAMVAGTTTVSTTWVLATTSNIQLTTNTIGGAQGMLSAPVASVTAGAGTGSFVINSSSGTDTSTVNYIVTNG